MMDGPTKLKVSEKQETLPLLLAVRAYFFVVFSLVILFLLRVCQ